MQPTFEHRFAYRSASTPFEPPAAMTPAKLPGDAVIAKLGQLAEIPENDRLLIRAGLYENVRQVMPRTNFVVEGTVPLRSIFVLSGWARQTKSLPDGRSQIQSLLLPGDLQDIDLFTQSAADHSLTALTPMIVVELRRERLRFLAERSLPLMRAFWINSIATGAVTREWAINLGQRTAVERIAHLFCELSYRLRGTGDASGYDFPMPLTQSDLAEATGLTPVHVNRTLQYLRSQSLIQLSHRRLTILDLGKLKEIAMFQPEYLRIGVTPVSDGPTHHDGQSLDPKSFMKDGDA